MTQMEVKFQKPMHREVGRTAGILRIVASLSGGVVVNYGYDALGRRVNRSSSVNGTTRFLYDGADVVRNDCAEGGFAPMATVQESF
jgi:YD repeat-containing protein